MEKYIFEHILPNSEVVASSMSSVTYFKTLITYLDLVMICMRNIRKIHVKQHHKLRLFGFQICMENTGNSNQKGLLIQSNI